MFNLEWVNEERKSVKSYFSAQNEVQNIKFCPKFLAQNDQRTMAQVSGPPVTLVISVHRADPIHPAAAAARGRAPLGIMTH